MSYTPSTPSGARIQGNSSQIIYFMYPSIPNKEALRLKNSPSILSPGVNHSTNSFLHNARAILVLHRLANGVSIGTKPGLHQTKSNLWQVNVLTTTIKTFEENDSLMDACSVLSRQNIPRNWLQLSSTSFAHGSPNHHPSIRTSPNGKASWQRSPLLGVHALQMAQVTTAQQTGQFPCLKTFSMMSENDGSHVSSTINFTQSLCKHAAQINPTRSSPMMKFYRSYKICNLVSHPAQWALLSWISSPSVWNSFTPSKLLLKILMLTLLHIYKKVFHQELFHLYNQLDYGNQTIFLKKTLQLCKYAKTTGVVQTRMPALSKRFPASKKLNVDG